MADVQAFPPSGLDEALTDRRQVPSGMGASQQSAGAAAASEPDPLKTADYARQGEFNRYSAGGGSGAGQTERPAPSVRPPPWGFYALVATLALGAVLAGMLLGNSLNDVVGLRAVRKGAEEMVSATSTEETTAARYIVPETSSAPTSTRQKKRRALKKRKTTTPLTPPTGEAPVATPAVEDDTEKKEEGEEKKSKKTTADSQRPRSSRRPTKKSSSTSGRARKKKAKAATH